MITQKASRTSVNVVLSIGARVSPELRSHCIVMSWHLVTQFSVLTDQ